MFHGEIHSDIPFPHIPKETAVERRKRLEAEMAEDVLVLGRHHVETTVAVLWQEAQASALGRAVEEGSQPDVVEQDFYDAINMFNLGEPIPDTPELRASSARLFHTIQEITAGVGPEEPLPAVCYQFPTDLSKKNSLQ